MYVLILLLVLFYFLDVLVLFFMGIYCLLEEDKKNFVLLLEVYVNVIVGVEGIKDVKFIF